MNITKKDDYISAEDNKGNDICIDATTIVSNGEYALNFDTKEELVNFLQDALDLLK